MSSTGEGPPGEESADQRARAQRTDAPPKRKRVLHFIQLFRENRYVKHLTLARLAEEWGLSERTLEADVHEASRSFEQTDEEKAVGKSIWLEQVRSAAANARELERCEAEARFLELQGKAEGFFGPQKVELSGSLGDLLSLATGKGGEDPDEPVGE